MRFSANLVFLWADLPLPEAIQRAADAGFDAVELHWPYATPAAQIKAALEATGLPLLGLNTQRGDVAAGEMGLSALPGRGAEARAAIAAALDYAAALGAEAIHVMAGKSQGPAAEEAFLEALGYACRAAGPRTILIEPINPVDAPGYFLRDTAHAAALIAALGAPNLKLMFDCYHVARVEGDVIACLAEHLPIIGHIQIAGVPGRGAPQDGTLDYRTVFAAIENLGWSRPLGAEYKPAGPPETTLSWRDLAP